MLLTSTVVLAAPISVGAFQDVPKGTELETAIESLSRDGVINGITPTLYAPERTIQRAHAAKIIAGVLGLDVKNVKNPNFKDVPVTHPQYVYIAALANANIIGGTGNGNFSPTANLTRGQMARILANAYQLKGSTTLPYVDTKGHLFEADVQKLYVNGIAKGLTATKFGVKDNVTRGQLALLVYRTEQKIKEGVLPKPNHQEVQNGDVLVYSGTYLNLKASDFGLTNIGYIPLQNYFGTPLSPIDDVRTNYQELDLQLGGIDYIAIGEYVPDLRTIDITTAKYYKVETTPGYVEEGERTYKLTKLPYAYTPSTVFRKHAIDTYIEDTSKVVVKDRNGTVLAKNQYSVHQQWIAYFEESIIDLRIEIDGPPADYFITYPQDGYSVTEVLRASFNGPVDESKASVYIEGSATYGTMDRILLEGAFMLPNELKNVSFAGEPLVKIEVKNEQFVVTPLRAGTDEMTLTITQTYGDEDGESFSESYDVTFNVRVEAYGNGYLVDFNAW